MNTKIIDIKKAIAKNEDKSRSIKSMRFVWLGKELTEDHDEQTLKDVDFKNNGIIYIAHRLHGGVVT